MKRTTRRRALMSGVGVVAAFLKLRSGVAFANSVAGDTLSATGPILRDGIRLTTEGKQLKAAALTTWPNGTPGPKVPDWPFSDGTNYNQEKSDQMIALLKRSGFNAVFLNTTWDMADSTSSVVSAGRMTESRAGLIRATTQVIKANLDLWFKPLINNGSKGSYRVTIDPGDYAAWADSFWTIFKATTDIIAEAAHSAGGSIKGVVLTSEHTAMCLPGREAVWEDLYHKVRERYPGVIITNTSIGIEFARFSDRYLNIWDLLATDAYSPLSQPNDPPPTHDQIIERLSILSYGGRRNFFGRKSPPIGLEGTAMVPYLRSVSKRIGKPWIFPEIGYEAVDGVSAGPATVLEGSDVATVTALNEQADDWAGTLDAYFDPANRDWFGGLAVWEVQPFGTFNLQGLTGGWIKPSGMAVNPPKPAWDVVTAKLRGI